MKKTLEKIKDSKGFVSLEVIAIAVIIIALAAFVMFKFRTTAESSTDSVDQQISGTMESITSDAEDTANN